VLGEAVTGEERRLIQASAVTPTPAPAAARAMPAPEEFEQSAAAPPTAVISSATSSTSQSSAHGWVSPDRPRPGRSWSTAVNPSAARRVAVWVVASSIAR
jgi:hypothetical protein